MDKQGEKIRKEKTDSIDIIDKEIKRYTGKLSSPISDIEILSEFIVTVLKQSMRLHPIEEYESTELGQAQAAADYLEGWIKYCPGIGWLIYDVNDGRFREDCGKAVLYYALNILATERWDLRNAQKNNKEIIEYAKRAVTKPGMDHVAGILQNDPHIWCDIKDFNKSLYLINCKGETYDLRTGEHFPSLPEHMHTKTTAFQPEFKSPAEFCNFLIDITCERADLGEWLMRWFGYSLTGDMSTPFIVNAWGGGKNGKSVLLNVMREIFGSYAMTISHNVVVENRHKSAIHDLAELPGVRLGIVPEVPPGRMATENVKTITGGDHISAEKKYLNPFSFKPIVKLTLVSNHRLELRDINTAMERRIRLVPFEFTVPDGKEIPDLEKQLLKEGPRILAWLIQEATAYLKNPGPVGFPPCEVIDKATKEYLEGEDIIQQFLDVRTVKEGQVKASVLYNNFVEWAETEGIKRPINQRMFGEKLLAKGIERIHTRGGNTYCDISLGV
jgi:putative DNA primase/helicase